MVLRVSQRVMEDEGVRGHLYEMAERIWRSQQPVGPVSSAPPRAVARCRQVGESGGRGYHS